MGHVTLPKLLSTGWFQEWDLSVIYRRSIALFYNEIEIN